MLMCPKFEKHKQLVNGNIVMRMEMCLQGQAWPAPSWNASGKHLTGVSICSLTKDWELKLNTGHSFPAGNLNLNSIFLLCLGIIFLIEYGIRPSIWSQFIDTIETRNKPGFGWELNSNLLCELQEYVWRSCTCLIRIDESVLIPLRKKADM
jgi:hypothetical protein